MDDFNTYQDEFGGSYTLNMQHSSNSSFDALGFVTSAISLLAMSTVFLGWISVTVRYLIGRMHVGVSLWKLLFLYDIYDFELSNMKVFFIILCVVQLIAIILRHIPGGKENGIYLLSSILGIISGICLIVGVVYFMVRFNIIQTDIQALLTHTENDISDWGELFINIIDTADSTIKLIIRIGFGAWAAMVLGLSEMVLSIVSLLMNTNGGGKSYNPNSFANGMNDDNSMMM